MAKFRVNPKSLENILKNYAKFDKDFIGKARIAMQNIIEDLVREIQTEILKTKSFDSGLLLASIQGELGKISDTIIEGRAFTDREYAGVIEFGRLPGKKPPPLRVLIPWAGRHGLIKSIPKMANPDREPYLSALKAAYAIRKRKAANGPVKLGAAKQMALFSEKKMSKKNEKKLQRIKDFLVLIAIQKGIGERGLKGRFPMTQALTTKRKTFTVDLAKFLTL